MVDIQSMRAEKQAKKLPERLVTEGAPILPPGQNYLAMALAKDNKGNVSPCFLGCFPTVEETQKHIDEIRKKAGQILTFT